MRDPRVDALAQILVRYSTKVKRGDVCSVAASTAAEPLVQAIYEEILRAGGLPIMQLQPSGAQAAFYDLASDEQLDWVPPTTEWTVENADVHISVMASLNTRELSHADPKKQARHQKARKTIMETSMRRAAEDSYRWALTLFPTHAYASEAGMSLARLRGLLLRGLPGGRRRPGERVEAPVRGDPAPHRVDPGQGGGPDPGGRHGHHPGRGRPQLDPLRRRAQHARRRVLHGARGGLRERRDLLLLPRELRRPDGLGRVPALRGREGRRRRVPSRARTS